MVCQRKKVSKKREEEAKAGSPAWMATFSDLMNLLLCFFVLLFSMSTINEEEWEKLKLSFQNTNSYSSFLSGGPSILDSSSANNELSVVENDFSANGTSDDDDEKVENLDESLATVQEQKEIYSEKMYDEVSQMLADQKLDGEIVNVEVDKEYNYIMLTLSGSLLFDSGAVELREDAKPTLSRLGDILLMFGGYQIEIIGHTDNMPVTQGSAQYKDNNQLSSMRALNTFYYLVNEKGLDPSLLKYSGRGEYEPIASNDTAKGRQQNRRVDIKIYNELSRY